MTKDKTRPVNNPVNQSPIAEANIFYCSWHNAQRTIGFGFTSDWTTKWREIFNQSPSVVMSSQSIRQYKPLPSCLGFKRSPGVSFTWGWVWWVRQWTCKKNLLPYVRLHIKARFEREVTATRKWLICFRHAIKAALLWSMLAVFCKRTFRQVKLVLRLRWSRSIMVKEYFLVGEKSAKLSFLDMWSRV